MFAMFADGVTPTVPTTFTVNLPDAVTNSRAALETSFGDAWHRVVAYTPNLVAAIVVLVVGYFVAKFVAHAVTVLCDRAGLQKAAERSGLWESMTHMNIKRNVPAIIGTIMFWFLMLVFLMAGFSILNISQVSGSWIAWSSTFRTCSSPR